MSTKEKPEMCEKKLFTFVNDEAGIRGTEFIAGCQKVSDIEVFLSKFIKSQKGPQASGGDLQKQTTLFL